MEMPSGHNPTHSIAWKVPPVPINLPTLGGPHVTAGRRVGPRPPETALADPARPRSGAQQEDATGAGTRVGSGTVCGSTLTPQNSHPGIPQSSSGTTKRPHLQARSFRVAISIPTLPTLKISTLLVAISFFLSFQPFSKPLASVVEPQTAQRPAGTLQPHSRHTQPILTPVKM